MAFQRDTGARLSNDGFTIIMTSHQPQHALAVANAVILLRGANYDIGAASKVLTEENLTALYGIPMHMFAAERDQKSFVAIAPDFSRHVVRKREQTTSREF